MDRKPAPILKASVCVKCGYPLRGLPANGACPECGALIETTMPMHHLAFAEADDPSPVPRAVRRLLMAAGALVIAALLLWVLLFLLA